MVTPSSVGVAALQHHVTEIQQAIASCDGIQEIADELMAKSFIDPEHERDIMARQSGLPPSEKSRLLVNAVITQAKENPNRFQVFIDILKERPSLKNLAAMLQEDYITRSSEQTGGGCEGDSGATGQGEPQTQSLATMPASVTLTDEESWDLSKDFAIMLCKLIPLIEKVLDVGTLKRFLRLFRDLRTDRPYVEPTIYQHLTSTAEVLEALALQRHFHAIQLNLLNTIVEEYGCDESRRLLKEYKSKIPKSAPLKRSCNELTDEEIDSSSGTKRLKVEISGDSDTYSLKDVEKAQEALAKTSGVSRDVIVFAKHEPGSVILTFIVPACTVESFTNIDKRKEHLSDLAAIGILSIKIDQVTIAVKAHFVSQEFAHPTELKPSTLKPTPSSEGRLSGGVEDLTEESQLALIPRIFGACVAGDLEEVLQCLSLGVDVNAQDEHDRTPLIVTSTHGHVAIVQALLERGAYIDAQDHFKERWTALTRSSCEGYVEVADTLLKAGAKPDSSSAYGVTALMYASSRGHSRIVDSLLKFGAKPNLRTRDGSSALMKAADKGHSDIIVKLLHAKADVDMQNQDGTTALMEASNRGYLDAVKELLAGKANVNMQDENHETALAKASYFGYYAVVQELLRAGAEPDIRTQDGRTPLMRTVKRLHDEKLQEQLGITRDGRYKTIAVLLDHNANPNIKEPSLGWTALFFAAKDGDIGYVKLLLEHGANPTIKDKNKVTALDLARTLGHSEVCDELLKHFEPRESKTAVGNVKEIISKALRKMATMYSAVEERLRRKKKLDRSSPNQDEGEGNITLREQETA